VSLHPEQKGLANLWNWKKIARKAHAGRGHENKWEMSKIEDLNKFSRLARLS
jgi:hypothetical protein